MNVDHKWKVSKSYTCGIESTQLDLYVGNDSTPGVSFPNGEEVLWTTQPEGFPDLVWENFPIEIDSTLIGSVGGTTYRYYMRDSTEF